MASREAEKRNVHREVGEHSQNSKDHVEDTKGMGKGG